MGERVSVGDHIGVGDRVRKAAGGRHGERPVFPGPPPTKPATARLQAASPYAATHQPIAGRDGAGRAHRGRPPRSALPSLGKAGRARHDDCSRLLIAADEKGRPRASHEREPPYVAAVVSDERIRVKHGERVGVGLEAWSERSIGVTPFRRKDRRRKSSLYSRIV